MIHVCFVEKYFQMFYLKIDEIAHDFKLFSYK